MSNRALKSVCHEIGHVFFIKHCQAYECIMNGSSQVEECDNKPFMLCPVCLRKISTYFHFNGKEYDYYH